jgi:hypothetical protein
MLYSPSGIIYLDQATNKASPWIIDTKRFTSKTLEQAIVPNPHDVLAARVDLQVGKEKTKRTIYFNQAAYEQWRKTLHTESYAHIEKSFLVLVHNPETAVRQSAILTLSIITPKG